MAKAKREKFIIDEKGEKQAVILDVKYYRRLLEVSSPKFSVNFLQDKEDITEEKS